MKQLPFQRERAILSGAHSAAYPDDGANLGEAVAEAIMVDIGTDLEVTIGDVTMFLAAWQSPDHWASEWSEKLGCDYDDAPAEVQRILADALEDR